MRLRFVVWFLIGLTATAVLVDLWQPETPYRAVLVWQSLEDLAAPDGSVVLLGDSIIWSLDAAEVAPRALNFGIGGSTSRGTLNRLGRYRSLAKARAIFLEIGINDLERGMREDLIANYPRLLEALPTEPKLYLIGILPIDETAFVMAFGNLTSNAEIAQLNAAFWGLCRQRANCVPLQPFDAGYLRADYHTGDGVHLSKAGYAILVAALKKALAEQ